MKKRLFRSKNDVKLAGVCGGIAEYFGLDPALIRLAWVLASIFLSAIVGGVIAYLICMMILPVDSGYVDAEYKEKL